MSVDLAADALVERFQCVIVIFFHSHGVHLAYFGEDVCYQGLVHRLPLLSPDGVHLPIGTCLVYQVYGLVGQEALVDEFVAGRDGKLKCLVGIVDTMKLLVVLFQSFQDLQGLFGRWFFNVNLLEASYQPFRFGEVAVVLIVGRRSDESYLARLQIGLEHVRGIHRSFARGTGSDKVVDLVDIDDVPVRLPHDAVHHLLDAFLEVAAELRACQQCADVELVDLTAFQSFRDIPYGSADELGQTVDKCGLADAWFSDMQRIVLLLPAEHLDGTFQFFLAAHQWVVVFPSIIEAGDEFSPRLLLLVSSCIRLVIVDTCLVVVVGIAGHEFAHEVLLPFA